MNGWSWNALSIRLVLPTLLRPVTTVNFAQVREELRILRKVAISSSRSKNSIGTLHLFYRNQFARRLFAVGLIAGIISNHIPCRQWADLSAVNSIKEIPALG
jgi:hypothetical protein